MIEFKETKIKDSYLIEFSPYSDHRGSLQRIFCKNIFGKRFGEVKQINYVNVRQKGTVKGVHLQMAPFEEDKIVICLKGSIFDVVVDLREKSDTLAKWHGVRLSENEDTALLIPKGCGHAFQTLTDDVSILYIHSEFYNKSLENGLNYLDKTIAIDWPIEITVVSDKDRALPHWEK